MGQKTNPIGLRVGLSRKWTSSWYELKKGKNLIAASGSPYSPLSNGVVAARGGFYFAGREDFVENLLKRYSVTKFSNARRLLSVDFRVFKGYGGQRYGFLIYTKLLTRR